METIKCKSCGAVQEVLTENTSCSFCGGVIEVESSKDFYKEAITGETGNLMAMADTAVDATNWDEALQFYNRVLEKDVTNSDAWLGKGIAIVYSSKIGQLKTAEAIAYWKNAIKHSSNKEAMGKRVAKEINTVVNSFYPTIENHYKEFNGLDDSYTELVSRFDILENALDYAVQLDESEIKYAETGYELCKRVIDLPQIYAESDKTSAQMQGVLAGLEMMATSNKYSGQRALNNAGRAQSSANERLKEIAKASKRVDEIQKKYTEIIQKLNPNHYSINELKTREEKQTQKINGKERRMWAYYGVCLGGISFVFFSMYIGARFSLASFIVWFLGAAILGGCIGYYLKSPKGEKKTINKPKPKEKKSKRNILIIIASVLLISVIAWVLINKQDEKAYPEDVYRQEVIDQNNEYNDDEAIKDEVDKVNANSPVIDPQLELNQNTTINDDINSNISPQNYGTAVIKNEKTYFFQTPSFENKRKAYLIEGDYIEFTDEQNGFVHAVFTNSQGRTTTGWISKNDIEIN